MTFRFPECGDEYATKNSLRRHYYRGHDTAYETPEEHRGPDPSEQVDIDGETPRRVKEDPEPLTENDTPETELRTLETFEEER